ncbi:MAG: type I pantothenate kinase [Actinomycetaceae bacterium]|nr:type I pantothenate kinase [Actinomycetaceae bacterium]
MTFLLQALRPSPFPSEVPPEKPQDTGAFRNFTRDSWAGLAKSTPLPLTNTDVRRLAGLGDPIDIAEVDAIYRPLSALLQLYVSEQRSLAKERATFLRENFHRPTPFIVGIAGSVAVGKSTTARILTEMMRRWPQTPNVSLVPTDGFLLPTAELQRRGLMGRKGFPESYDRRALLRFLRTIKSGVTKTEIPIYSHQIYDIVPGEKQQIISPDVIVLEGLNVLQPPMRHSHNALGISDFFDFSIYIDAHHSDIEKWYVDRFLRLRETAFQKPDSYFRSYADLSDGEAVATAKRIWNSINLPNLMENIRPTRGRARLIMTKDADHRVRNLRLRKV